jgi:hypothetical protein
MQNDKLFYESTSLLINIILYQDTKFSINKININLLNFKIVRLKF